MIRSPGTKLNVRAFTLLDIVVAIGILSLVLIILIGILTTAGMSAHSTQESVIATSVAESELDRWKREDFSTLVGLVGANPATIVVADGRDHNVSTEISRMDPTSSDPDYDTLILHTTVTWSTRTVDPSTRARVGRVSIETQVTPSGQY